MSDHTFFILTIFFLHLELHVELGWWGICLLEKGLRPGLYWCYTIVLRCFDKLNNTDLFHQIHGVYIVHTFCKGTHKFTQKEHIFILLIKLLKIGLCGLSSQIPLNHFPTSLCDVIFKHPLKVNCLTGF